MQRSIPIALLAGLAAVAASAQGGPFVTETNFLSALDGTHPAVRESAEAVARAEAAALAARTFTNPVLRALREAPGGKLRQAEVLVSWQVPGAERMPEIAAREGAVAAARSRLELDLLEHRLAMKSAYAAWAVAAERQQRLNRQAERVELLARREGLRAEQGESSGLEARRLLAAAAILRSRVALAAAASERARSEAAAWRPDLAVDARPVLPTVPSAAMPELRAVAGAASGSTQPEADQEHLSDSDPPRPRGRERADGQRDDARVLAARADLAAAELARAASSRFIPSPEVSLGWQRQELAAAAAGDLSGPVFGLAWSVPLLDRRRPARLTALAAVDGARARLERAEREGAAARASGRMNLSRLAAALSDARAALGDGRQMLDMAEAAFRLGENGVTDLLETHRSVTEAELALLDLHEAVLAAARELERLAGGAAVAEEGGQG